jgi:hypothetical protein
VSVDILKETGVMTRITMMHQEATEGEAMVAGGVAGVDADAEGVNLQGVEVLHVVEVAEGAVEGLDKVQIPLTLMTVSG